MKEKIFVISGLGADDRMFMFLEFEQFEMIHLSWVKPSKEDTLNTYAKKLLPQITEENPIVLGLSLGGMIAAEVGSLIQPKCIISLSSMTCFSELPPLYKVCGSLRFHRFLPLKWFAKSNFLTNWFFGAKQKNSKLLLKSTLKEIDPYFLKWALNAVLTWKNNVKPDNLFRIHGTNDYVLRANTNVNYCALIEGGGHLMVLENYERVQSEIENILNKL